MFEKLVWLKDRVLVDDLVFRIEYDKTEDWELGGECFHLYKNKYYIHDYEKLLTRTPYVIANVLELGIFDGGSLAIWNECLEPTRLVGIDIRSDRGDSDYFRRYIENRGLRDRVKTYWGVDQADVNAISQIVQTEFDAPLDLVVDDASHLYHPTKTSFETLFPLLREGGMYVIEDWCWGYSAEHTAKEVFSTERQSLIDLTLELAESVYTHTISNLIVTECFIVAERGPLPPDRVRDFELKIPPRYVATHVRR